MIAIALAVYIIGLLILYTWGQLNQGWYEYYYIWDKGKDLLLFIGLLLVIEKKYKDSVKPIILFSSVRLIWQIISSITGLDINNTRLVGIMFIALAMVCSFITLKELIKWRR